MHDSLPDGDFPDKLTPSMYDWPVCPQCGRRRLTACPICQTAGAAFPLAEDAPAALADDIRDESATGQTAAELQNGRDIAGDRGETLLMCPTCDEAFSPRYYRCCEQCGHRFGDGVDSTSPPPELAGRALWLLAGMLLLAAALCAYFWAILRS